MKEGESRRGPRRVEKVSIGGGENRRFRGGKKGSGSALKKKKKGGGFPDNAERKIEIEARKKEEKKSKAHGFVDRRKV